mmetsp:Transcript_1262/g.4287  ORF Transcript_1262/g.4287 Transcript_1262/m.4287 type:complete len:263 (+) Transcript_1262:90-878(+)
MQILLNVSSTILNSLTFESWISSLWGSNDGVSSESPRVIANNVGLILLCFVVVVPLGLVGAMARRRKAHAHGILVIVRIHSESSEYAHVFIIVLLIIINRFETSSPWHKHIIIRYKFRLFLYFLNSWRCLNVSAQRINHERQSLTEPLCVIVFLICLLDRFVQQSLEFFLESLECLLEIILGQTRVSPRGVEARNHVTNHLLRCFIGVFKACQCRRATSSEQIQRSLVVLVQFAIKRMSLVLLLDVFPVATKIPAHFGPVGL